MGSRHFSEGAYDRIAKKLFQDLNADTVKCFCLG